MPAVQDKALPGNATSGNDLTKLTVPLLKALCKEKKIPGYSKLGKQALIQKLVEAGCSSGGSLVAAPCPLVSDSYGLSAPNAPEVIGACRPVPALPHGSMLMEGNGSVSDGLPSLANSLRTPTHAQRGGKSKALIKSSSKPTANVVSVSTLPSETVPHTGASSPSALTSDVAAQIAEQSDLVLGDSRPASSGDLYPIPSARGSTVTKQALDGKKRKRVVANEIPSSAKKACIQPQTSSIEPPQPGLQVNARTSASKPLQSRLSVTVDISQPLHAPPAVASATRPTIPPSLSHALPKRFRPLVVHKSKLLPRPSARLSVSASAVFTRPHDQTAQPQDLATPLHYLDLSISPTLIPALCPISLPPPLAQRKRVAAWAVILSGLSDSERATCALVSRTFRYAVYLSATSILNRDYCGSRLQEDALKRYPQAMTNMWPYLRLREAEVTQRRCIYEASFVARFFIRCGYDNPITPRLWASPDNPKQLVIAIRFALTRMWFELSVGTSSGTKEDPDSWLNGTIIDVQEIVADEIWSVSLVYARSAMQAWKQETVYVLEATCEVVGRSPQSHSDESAEDTAAIPLRADWSAYIVQRSALSPDDAPLLSHLKWSCHEEYDKGMSRLWLQRIAQEGEVGLVKRIVAERYILACVVSNGISGQWMTAHAMAQDFAGLPSRTGPGMENKKAKAVNLYLPEHHHVESVHFTTSRRDPLHPAVAVVQTPHREYFILRDNGMQVGCEEEGVAEVWQEVLGCDRVGRGLLSV
ncbi:hypothetical protein GY45DRAFT_1288163 [Cubamyces sp. BRFM 1775]|nr:hypothetical protein GY45DRAFT_1288163 [Cubamyces sp. BRFM 1775]